jgi:hypothetical protein
MKPEATKLICRLLVVSMLAMPLQAARAGMISTDQAIATTSAQSDRAAVLSVINRGDIARQLQSLGVDPKAASDRVAAMTDEEVRTLAGKIDSVPAGALSSGAGWAIAVVIALVIWYYYYR